MNSKWTLAALLFSVAVNIAVVGTLFYFWRNDIKETHEFNIERVDEFKGGHVWFQSMHGDNHKSEKMDSLRRLYQDDLFRLEKDISDTRNNIVQILLDDPIDTAKLDGKISQLAQEQTKVERLTIDHLIAIKPHLEKNEWRLFLNDLRPHRRIHTKIIQLSDDTSKIFLNDSEMHIIDNIDEKEIIIEHKKLKQKRSEQ